MKRTIQFNRLVLSMALAALTFAAVADSPSMRLSTVGTVGVNCPKPGGWTFSMEPVASEPGVDVIRIVMTANSPAQPPEFSVGWFVSQRGINHVWTSESTHYGIPWSEPMNSELAAGLPLAAFLDVNDESRFVFACSESCRKVVFKSPISETKMGFYCSYRFFTVPEAPIASYAVQLRFDARNGFYGDRIGDAAHWMSHADGISPMRSPEGAFDPLYSTWYTFHQEVSAALVEEECALAADLGMKTVIVDDGWQIDLPLKGRGGWGGYRLCGDWQAGRNFPDMAAHVRRVQALGFKYMLWYSVPFVGEKSANFARFKGKYLPVSCAGGHVLDPRFPEVREFIVGTYEKAVRDWNLDGLKLDFIGRFALKDGVTDPALAENFAGRDIKSIPLAVDALLTAVKDRLMVLKPDILIEFRQPYVGPSIRRFGNMLRATDCPLSMVENRTRIARIRLTAGQTAVHSDMLEWRSDETPESAALTIINAIFGVVQYSVRLKALSADHRRMLAHWLRFTETHKRALLKGTFRPRYPASDYPLLEGESESERIIGVYQENLVVQTGAADRTVCLLNGTRSNSVTVDMATGFEKAVIYDTYGTFRGEIVLVQGIRSISVPKSGYAILHPRNKLTVALRAAE